MLKNKSKGQEKVSAGVGTGTGLVIGIAAIYILFGLAMLYLPKFQAKCLIYIVGAVLIVYGAVLVAKYFIVKEYRILGKYGFTVGVVSALVGGCLLLRSKDIAPYLFLFLGICIFITSVLKLQTALDLRGIRNKGWWIFLVIAVLFLAASVLILLDPKNIASEHMDWIYCLLIADGAVNILCTIFTFFAIRISGKRESAASAEDKPKKEKAGLRKPGKKKDKSKTSDSDEAAAKEAPAVKEEADLDWGEDEQESKENEIDDEDYVDDDEDILQLFEDDD